MYLARAGTLHVKIESVMDVIRLIRKLRDTKQVNSAYEGNCCIHAVD